MNPAISFAELLDWNCQSTDFWKAHLEANPALLDLPCGIAGMATVQALVRHIWAAELIWSQRIAALPVTDRSLLPTGPVQALFELHLEAVQNFRRLLSDAAYNWEEPIAMDYSWLPAEVRRPTPRKLMAHVLFHGQRHWAQLATLVRAAGFPSGFKGDLLFSSTLE
jgi:uncharacterized damage-inducible protein DinB